MTRGKNFDNDDKPAVKSWFSEQLVNLYKEGFENLMVGYELISACLNKQVNLM